MSEERAREGKKLKWTKRGKDWKVGLQTTKNQIEFRSGCMSQWHGMINKYITVRTCFNKHGKRGEWMQLDLIESFANHFVCLLKRRFWLVFRNAQLYDNFSGVVSFWSKILINCSTSWINLSYSLFIVFFVNIEPNEKFSSPIRNSL